MQQLSARHTHGSHADLLRGRARSRRDTAGCVSAGPRALHPTAPRRPAEAGAERVVEDGIFSLLPGFASEVAYGRKTYNARSETVATLASFQRAWRDGQRCIVPAECFFEPNWETGSAVRWRIGQAGDVPLGIAGIFASSRHPDGREMSTFAMLTVNADEHPLMHRFHRPGEEKRMVVILHRGDYAEWLSCTVADARKFFKR